MDFKTVQVSSLQRVFLDGRCDLTEHNCDSVLKGERYSYQIAYKSSEKFFAEIVIDSPLSQFITVRSVGNVPSELPVYETDCEFCERNEPGLFPDVLFPIENNRVLIKRQNFYALWITVDLPKDTDAGDYEIKIKLKKDGETISENIFGLHVINAVLPEQKLIYTQWFHSDSIANYYKIPVFCEKFWALVKSFIKAAVHTGVNMLLTPVFTPPLDTEIGGERLTVQLVDVKLENGKYSFGFDRFIRWVRLAQKCGIKYFEISHLFSQWGAKYAPKIMAEVNGRQKRIFGWETSADSIEYDEFLSAFIPQLIKVIRSLGIEKSTFFHISDEPNEDQIESYSMAKSAVAPLLEDFPIIDALSDYSFYESGIINNPIPCTNDIESFIEKGFPHPWTYYCCGQGGKLSNRFFGMPLSTTRIIGFQLFKYGIEGFLQWGFNFYNSQYSLRSIDPFAVTDADSAFPSGDSFTVYPGKSGAIESVRSEVFFQALQDMRALTLLCDRIGKKRTIAAVEADFGIITFFDYPRGTEKMLNLRKSVNNYLDNLHKQ
ncbi:MAG: DUF4091 domain-containing protein [Acutalibacteraceae bacterium]|nr:DUF4091 domain-containing protein [Acutalibacteraceae bacterium]